MDEWPILGPALVAASAGTMEALLTLRPLRREVDESNVLRSLYEYTTTFSWIASDPATRARRWLKYDYAARLRTDSDFRAAGIPLLEDGLRAELEAYGADISSMPDLAARAEGADARWGRFLGDRLPDAAGYASFRDLYRLVFRGASGFTHPTSRALTRFVEERQGEFCVDMERPHDGALLTASFMLALALLVADNVLHWPAGADAVLACLALVEGA